MKKIPLTKRIIKRSARDLKKLFYGSLPPETAYYLRKKIYGAILRRYSCQEDLPIEELKNIHIIMGLACNYRCRMCYQTDFSKKLDPDIYLNSLKGIYQNIEEIIIQGGEPTIMAGARELIGFLTSRYENMKISTFTNGYLFDGWWRETFAKNGGFVNFSINAAGREKYSEINGKDNWDQAVYNLQRLINIRNSSGSGLEIRSSFVILEENLGELYDFVCFFHKLGVDRISFFYDMNLFPSNTGEARCQIDSINRYRKENTGLAIEGLDSFGNWIFNRRQGPPLQCKYPFNSIFIDESGNVYFCCLISKSIGNLNYERIEALWNNILAKNIRARFKNGDYRYCGHYCIPHD